MARLDRLGAAAREIAQTAAAIGREFSYDLVTEAAPRAEAETSRRVRSACRHWAGVPARRPTGRGLPVQARAGAGHRLRHGCAVHAKHCTGGSPRRYWSCLSLRFASGRPSRVSRSRRAPTIKRLSAMAKQEARREGSRSGSIQGSGQGGCNLLRYRSPLAQERPRWLSSTPRSTCMRRTLLSDPGTACRTGPITFRATRWWRRWTRSASTARSSSPPFPCTNTTPVMRWRCNGPIPVGSRSSSRSTRTIRRWPMSLPTGR